MKIRDLMKSVEEKIIPLNMDYYKITQLLFTHPFITVTDLTTYMSFSRQTSSKYIKILEKEKVISTVKI